MMAKNSVSCPNCDGHLELLQKQTSRVRHYYKCHTCGLGRIDYYPSETKPDIQEDSQ